MAEAHARWVAAPGALRRALLVSHSGLRMSAHMERGVRHAPRGPPPPGSLPASSRSPRAPWPCYPAIGVGQFPFRQATCARFSPPQSGFLMDLPTEPLDAGLGQTSE